MNRFSTIETISSRVKKAIFAPPPLEVDEALALGLGPHEERLVLAEVRVPGIELLEIVSKPRTVELAGGEIGHQARRPHPTGQPARQTHRVDTSLAAPVRQGRTVQHRRAGHTRTVGGEQCHGPAGLAIAVERGTLTRVATHDLGNEASQGMVHMRQGLVRARQHVVGHEIDRMAAMQSHAHLRVALESTDSWPMSGTWVKDDHRPAVRARAVLETGVSVWEYSEEAVAHLLGKVTCIQHYFVGKLESQRQARPFVIEQRVAALG